MEIQVSEGAAYPEVGVEQLLSSGQRRTSFSAICGEETSGAWVLNGGYFTGQQGREAKERRRTLCRQDGICKGVEA